LERDITNADAYGAGANAPGHVERLEFEVLANEGAAKILGDD